MAMDRCASLDDCLYVGMVRKMLTQEFTWFFHAIDTGWVLLQDEHNADYWWNLDTRERGRPYSQ